MFFSKNGLSDTVVLEVRLPNFTADEHMAGGFPYPPIFFISLPDQWLYIVTYIYIHLTA